MASRTTSLDPAVVAIGDAAYGFVRVVVDSEVDPLGVTSSPGQRGSAGVSAAQGGWVEAGLGLLSQPSLVVGQNWL